MIIRTMMYFFCGVSALSLSSEGVAARRTHTRAASALIVLKHLNWKTKEQLDALEKLFQCADILEAKQTLAQRFPVRAQVEDFVEDVSYIIQATQDAFRFRSFAEHGSDGHKVHWLIQHKEIVLECLKKLNMFEEKHARLQNIDAVCIFGARLPTMQNRVQYSAYVMTHTNIPSHYIMLAGERKATHIDGSEQTLSDIAKEYKLALKDDVTETVLARYVYEKSNMPHKSQMTFHVINTAAKDGARPTTETTLEEGLRFLKRLGLKRAIFISNAPFIQYQNAILEWVAARQKSRITYEVVGNSKAYDFKDQAKSLEDAKQGLDGLAGFLWSAIPHILCRENFSVTRACVEKMLKVHYERCPMIYEALLVKADSSY